MKTDLITSFEETNTIKEYNLRKLNPEEIIGLFGDELDENIFNNGGFIIKNIYQNQDGVFIFEMHPTHKENYFTTGVVLNDAQKEVFKIDTQKDIIFLFGKISGKHFNEIGGKYQEIGTVLDHELKEIKYWSMVKDRLSFVPRPENLAFFHKKGFNINEILNKDEEILTREFVRQELIHYRANYENLGKSRDSLERGLIIFNFDNLDFLEDEQKEKLKKSYTKAIKIIQFLFLLNKKGYLEEEYNIDLLIKDFNPKIKNILQKIPQSISWIIQKINLKVISQINEEDFLDILQNPEGKIQEIAAKNNTKYKIDKLKIEGPSGGFRYPDIDIDGYFSQKIWVKTTVTLNNLNANSRAYIEKHISKFKEKLINKINIYLQLFFSNLENYNEYYIDIGLNYFEDKKNELNFEVEEFYEYYNSGSIYTQKEIKYLGIQNIEELKEIIRESYEIVVKEIQKEQANKKQELENKQESLQNISEFDFGDTNSEFDFGKESEIKKIDFSDIIIEDYKLFNLVEEFKKAITKYYNFQNIKIIIEEIESLDTSSKQIIIKNEKGEIIFDMTFDLNNQKQPIEFHFYRFCEGQEEETSKQIIEYVKSAGVIELEQETYDLDEALKQERTLQNNT